MEKADRKMVEAAGVEPASENNQREESTCVSVSICLAIRHHEPARVTDCQPGKSRQSPPGGEDRPAC